MALRPQRFLLEGVIDKTRPNRVVGWLKFAGLPDVMTLDIATAGKDLDRDEGDGKIALLRNLHPERPEFDYWDGVSPTQTGRLGVTVERSDYGWYISWFSKETGHVTLELGRGQLRFQ